MGRMLEIEDVVMSDSKDANGELSDSSTDIDLVENMVVIPIPGPSVVHTLVPADSEYIPPILRGTPSPLYIAEQAEDPEHHSVLEYWAEANEKIEGPLSL
jgi:hypothetical protein